MILELLLTDSLKKQMFEYNNFKYYDLKQLFYSYCMTNGFSNISTSDTTLTFSNDNVVYQLIDGISEWKIFQSNNQHNKYCAKLNAVCIDNYTFIECKKYDIILDTAELNELNDKCSTIITRLMTDSYYNYYTAENSFDKKSQLLLIDNLLTVASIYKDRDMIEIFTKVKELVSINHSVDFKIENILLDNNTPIFFDIVYK